MRYIYLSRFNIPFCFCNKFIKEFFKIFLNIIFRIHLFSTDVQLKFNSNKQKSFSFPNIQSILFVPLYGSLWAENQYRSSRRPIIDAWECQTSIDSLAEARLCARTFWHSRKSASEKVRCAITGEAITEVVGQSRADGTHVYTCCRGETVKIDSTAWK